MSYTNNGRVAAQDVSLDLRPPAAGWNIQAATSSSFPAVAPGETVLAKWTVTPAADSSAQQSSNAAPSEVSLTAAAKYRWPSSDKAAETDGSASIYTPPPGWQTSLPSLASAFNSVGITDDSHPAGGDLYNGDWSYSAQALAAAGLSPGATVQYDGLSFHWPDAAPGTPDNVRGGPGEWIAAAGSGNTLSMLATTTGGGAFEDGLVVYTDGTADAYGVQLPNWTDNPGAASTAAAMPYRNYSGGQNNTAMFIDLMKMPLNPDKQVAGVLLPTDPYFHLFSIAVGSSN